MSGLHQAEDFGARLSFDRSEPGRRAVDVPRWGGPETELPDERLLRGSPRLPELSQPGLVRYYTALSQRNYGVDSGTLPAGLLHDEVQPQGERGLSPRCPGSLKRTRSRHLRTCRAALGGAVRTAARPSAEITGDGGGEPRAGGWSARRTGGDPDGEARVGGARRA